MGPEYQLRLQLRCHVLDSVRAFHPTLHLGRERFSSVDYTRPSVQMILGKRQSKLTVEFDDWYAISKTPRLVLSDAKGRQVRRFTRVLKELTK